MDQTKHHRVLCQMDKARRYLAIAMGVLINVPLWEIERNRLQEIYQAIFDLTEHIEEKAGQKPQLTIHNQDGTKTVVNPPKMWSPIPRPEKETPDAKN